MFNTTPSVSAAATEYHHHQESVNSCVSVANTILPSDDSDDDTLPPSLSKSTTLRKGKSPPGTSSATATTPTAALNPNASTKKKRIRKFTSQERLHHRTFEKSRRESFKFNLGMLASLLPNVAFTETKRLSKHVVTNESSLQHRKANSRCRQALASARALLAERDEILVQLNYFLANAGKPIQQPKIKADDFSLLYDFENDAAAIKNAALAMGRQLNANGEPKMHDDEEDYHLSPSEQAEMLNAHHKPGPDEFARATMEGVIGPDDPLGCSSPTRGVAEAHAQQPYPQPHPQTRYRYSNYPQPQQQQHHDTGQDSEMATPLQASTSPGGQFTMPHQQADPMFLNLFPPQQLPAPSSETSPWSSISSPQLGDGFYVASMGPSQQHQHPHNHHHHHHHHHHHQQHQQSESLTQVPSLYHTHDQGIPFAQSVHSHSRQQPPSTQGHHSQSTTGPSWDFAS
ncbi:hypothetical protein CFO_g2814 [Ceratocystis platani]|uniref:BHLH domain-containing protein n=1 Tax=Ceratocystis fimbriata f. sp. platani TaxID=88771 RepID=A0A0F8B3W7_CERFI|nr:hypothetical protein CFO_g2814 [Ceratocystis platani]